MSLKYTVKLVSTFWYKLYAEMVVHVVNSTALVIVILSCLRDACNRAWAGHAYCSTPDCGYESGPLFGKLISNWLNLSKECRFMHFAASSS